MVHYTTHRCGICREEKTLDQFYYNASRQPPVHSRCKECDKERSKSRREYFRQYMRNDSIQNKQKWRARQLARTKLEKKPCAVCGNLKVDAHHEDYSKPLDVIWLCHEHHFQFDRRAVTLNPQPPRLV